jgi:flagellar motor switch protein FliM
MGVVRDSDRIRPYDFQRPHQLSRIQLDGVTNIFATFWRTSGNFLSAYLRTPVQLQQMSVYQVNYEELIQSLNAPAVLGVFDSTPLPGSALFECTPTIAVAMIDRALGGQGIGVTASRRLSDIEQTIMKRIFERLLGIYGDVWEPLAGIRPKLLSMEHNPAFAQIAGEGDLVLVSRQQLSIDSNRGQMMMVWPYLNVAPLAEAAVRAQLVRDGSLENVDVKRDAMKKHVESVAVHGSVLLGKTELSLGEFDQLKVGDAIVLKNRFDQPLVLRLSNRDKFLVLPGRSRGRLAVRVISRRGAD